MPLFEIDLDESLRPKLTEIRDGIHQAMIDGLGGSPTDKFQIYRFHPSDSGEMVFDPTHAGVDRQSVVWIRIVMGHKYDAASKQKLFSHLATELSSVGLRQEDLLVSIVEQGFDDVYAGKLKRA